MVSAGNGDWHSMRWDYLLLNVEPIKASSFRGAARWRERDRLLRRLGDFTVADILILETLLRGSRRICA
jgi:hypothetical protein